VYPFRAKLAEEGGEFVVVPRPRDAAWTGGIIDAIDERTAVVVAPQCHWTDGSAVDLVAVGAAARAAGAALVIDTSQSLGAFPLDVKDIRPDFMVSVGYKWQMGPYAFGYLWAAEQHRHGSAIEHTWIGRKGSDDFNRLVDYTDEVRDGSRRFDVGEWSNFTLLPMAAAAIDLVTGWKPVRVSTALAPLTARVEEGARRIGLAPVASRHRLAHMVGVRFPRGEPAGLRERLAAERVFVSLRANAVRVAPHLYNDAADVDRLLNILEDAVG
jgi:selenocysteine lyase/cysteine desulfurase